MPLGWRNGCVAVGGAGKAKSWEAEAHRLWCGVQSLQSKMVLPP